MGDFLGLLANRNPHDHRATDTPKTLDDAFLADVTRLALARVLTRAG